MTGHETFNPERLHPKARDHFMGLAAVLEDQYRTKQIATLFRPFEGYRSPERQNYLFHVTKTTKAKAFQSAHNYGLAVDYVPWVNGTWSWDEHHRWDALDFCATQRGLFRPIKWDRPHIEHPIWAAVKGSLI